MSTEQSRQVVFGPFRFDPVTSQLMKGEQTVSLQPKPLAVLLYLAQRSGQIVTKQELLKAVWTGTIVTKAVVKECLRAIRAALGEDVVIPQYIETVGREGYRFIALPTSTQPDQSLKSEVQGQISQTSHEKPITPVIGRETELQRLHSLLDHAVAGRRQVVFISGEPGIGKTTLVDRFLTHLREDAQVQSGRGQCIEQHGQGEAYLPVLDALGHLCREPRGEQVIAVLRRCAPTWLVQMPAVVAEQERKALQEQVQGVTQQRMLREMAEALAVLTTERALVLVFEDLHWSDYSTLELIAYLAQRRERARLLVIGTYRPADAVLSRHPLKGMKQELQAHGQCEEIRVEFLTEPEVIEYVTGRFPETPFTPTLGRLVHQRTEGNALFMVDVVEDLLRQGAIAQEDGSWTLKGDMAHVSVPDTLRQLIEKHLVQLREEEQQVLEVASVVGAEFAVAVVAAGLKQDAEAVEEICEDLAWQGHFLAERGIEEWPDGTISGRYGFRHALYQNVLYERIAEARQIRLHRLIGERAESAYGARAGEIAAELAVHFERGHDYHRAVQYYEQAGRNAIRRSAHVEAVSLLTTGLEWLKTLPDTPERVQQELMLQITLGVSLITTKGYTVPEVEKAYTRALELCRSLGETPQLFRVLQGLSAFYISRGELHTARELTEQMMRLAQSVQNPVFLLEAHRLLGVTLFWLGEFTSARAHLEQGITLYDTQQHSSQALIFVQDSKVHCLSYRAWTLQLLGYPNQALKGISEALTLAQDFPHSFSQAWAWIPSAEIHQLRREGQLTLEQAEATITLSTNQGFPITLAMGTLLRGWALAVQGQGEEGIVQIRWGMTALQTTGLGVQGPYCFALLAEAYGKAGQIEAGLTALADALAMVNKNGEHWWEAELYRLKGELLLEGKNQKAKGKSQKALAPNTYLEAEGYFLKAIEIARHQQAKSLELRAATSLARLWQQQGNKKQEAHQMLVEIYGWFTEGFDTKDLQETKALLDSFT